MTDFSRQETADRAAASIEDVNQLVELGILTLAEGDRFSGGDVRRIGVVKTLEHGGLPVEGLAALMRTRDISLDFLDSPLYERLGGFSTVTFRQLSEQTGIPLELLLVVREALGSAIPEPDDLVREDELAVVPFLQVQVSEKMSHHATERLLRVMGESLRRVAEQQAGWWMSEVQVPLMEKGVKAGDIGDVTAELGIRINVAYQQAFEAIQHAHEARTWTDNILTGIELAMTQAGLYSRQDARRRCASSISPATPA